MKTERETKTETKRIIIMITITIMIIFSTVHTSTHYPLCTFSIQWRNGYSDFALFDIYKLKSKYFMQHRLYGTPFIQSRNEYSDCVLFDIYKLKSKCVPYIGLHVVLPFCNRLGTKR